MLKLLRSELVSCRTVTRYTDFFKKKKKKQLTLALKVGYNLINYKLIMTRIVIYNAWTRFL